MKKFIFRLTRESKNIQYHTNLYTNDDIDHGDCG